MLHCKGVESAVYHGHGAGNEFCGVAHQIMYCAAQFVRVAHSSERSLAYHVLSALCVCAVGIGQQCTVLVGKEKTWVGITVPVRFNPITF